MSEVRECKIVVDLICEILDTHDGGVKIVCPEMHLSAKGIDQVEAYETLREMVTQKLLDQRDCYDWED